ncbi:MAG: ATP-binding protein [Pseudomonadota bacterium]
MKSEFARTKNVMRFLTGTTVVSERGAPEASWMLVHGKAGYGKTGTLMWWAARTGAIYLRAKERWSPRWFLQELVEAAGASPAHYSKALMEQAVGLITRAQDEAEYDSSRYPAVIIDEADNTTHDSGILETARDLSDLTEIPVILSGMARFTRFIQKRDQIYSRFAEIVEYGPNDADDVRAVCSQLAEVTVADDLIERITHESHGRVRSILNAIARCETHAKRNRLTTLTADHMKGQELVRDIDALAARAAKAGR